ncbi:MAG: hypothetical protein WDO68_10510 [Gammaproteobacteria bacterium]
MKRQTATSLIVAALVLAGCGGGGKGEVGATNPASGNGNPGGATPPEQNAPSTALFQPLQGVLPYPTDVYFLGSTDGTLNIQPANALMPLQSSVNQLDGFSTNAVIRTRFASALSAGSLSATSVYMAQVVIDSATKAVKGFTRKLVLGTDPAVADFSATLATDVGVGNTILELRPLKPLVPSSGPGAENVGYLVVLTNGITTTTGTAAIPDTDYANFKSALPTCAAVTNTSLNGLCKLAGAQLQVAGQALAINPANVVLSFSFSTQNTRDTMSVLAAVTTARPISVVNTGLTTAALTPTNSPVQLPGHANLYKGTLQIPYYSSRPTQANPTAPLTATWLGGPSALDASSKLLTRFNPVPIATETISIPVFATVPNTASPSGGTKPGGGWPVIIFQHGLTRNRLDAVGVADAFADQGYVVVSIDLPLHGIAGADAVAANPFYDATHELTFNLDFVDNTTLATGPDGKIDPSGTHFVNVPNPLVTRDNIRQGAVDLLTLNRSLGALDRSRRCRGRRHQHVARLLHWSLARRHRRRGLSRDGGRVRSSNGRARERRRRHRADDLRLARIRPAYQGGARAAGDHRRLDAIRAIHPRCADGGGRGRPRQLHRRSVGRAAAAASAGGGRRHAAERLALAFGPGSRELRHQAAHRRRRATAYFDAGAESGVAGLRELPVRRSRFDHRPDLEPVHDEGNAGRVHQLREQLRRGGGDRRRSDRSRPALSSQVPAKNRGRPEGRPCRFHR